MEEEEERREEEEEGGERKGQSGKERGDERTERGGEGRVERGGWRRKLVTYMCTRSTSPLQHCSKYIHAHVPASKSVGFSWTGCVG